MWWGDLILHSGDVSGIRGSGVLAAGLVSRTVERLDEMGEALAGLYDDNGSFVSKSRA